MFAHAAVHFADVVASSRFRGRSPMRAFEVILQQKTADMAYLLDERLAEGDVREHATHRLLEGGRRVAGGSRGQQAVRPEDHRRRGADGSSQLPRGGLR